MNSLHKQPDIVEAKTLDYLCELGWEQTTNLADGQVKLWVIPDDRRGNIGFARYVHTDGFKPAFMELPDDIQLLDKISETGDSFIRRTIKPFYIYSFQQMADGLKPRREVEKFGTNEYRISPPQLLRASPATLDSFYKTLITNPNLQIEK